MTHLAIIFHVAAFLAAAATIGLCGLSIWRDLTRPLVTVPRDEPEWDFTPCNPSSAPVYRRESQEG